MFGLTLGMRLRGAYLTFHRRANQFYSRLGVTADQFVVLTALAEAGDLTQTELVRGDQLFRPEERDALGALLGRIPEGMTAPRSADAAKAD
jgi:hypothetical protein